MYNDDVFDEETTVEEDIENLLRRISRDMLSGRLQAACRTLKELKGNGEQYYTVQATPKLRMEYARLSQHCP